MAEAMPPGHFTHPAARDAAKTPQQLAVRSGQVLNLSALGGIIGMEKTATENYLKLLEAVFLVQRLPAWGTTLGARVARHPKVHIVDSGVMAWLLNLTPEKIAQADPAFLTDYGHLIETFAVGEILKQVSWSDAPVTPGHFRTGSGDEADLVLARLGSRLEAAIVLNTGVHSHTQDGWPSSRSWSTSATWNDQVAGEELRRKPGRVIPVRPPVTPGGSRRPGGLARICRR